jgi:UDP-N-acetylmuramyl pentapeptide phosphotransferase/UDP-N-acetylglucosamine-1-phosphate transferase
VQHLLLSIAVAAAGAMLSAAISLLLIPVLRENAMAHVTERSSHAVPTPQGGGFGVVAAALAAGLFAVATAAAPPRISTMAIILSGMAALALVGAIDDRRALSVRLRLGVQFVIAAMFVALLPPLDVLGPLVPALIERALCVLAIVATVNMVNSIDGSDLVTVAHALPALIGFGILHAARDGLDLVCFAAAGALAGFAVLNWPPARLFLGDVGSVAIGFLLAAMATLTALDGQALAALALLAYPLLDAGLTLFMRWRRGADLAKAHRDHAYQAARIRGVPALQVAFGVASASAMSTLVTLAALEATPRLGGVVGLVVALSLSSLLMHWFRTGRVA